MRKYIRIGVDIAKNSFQVHALESEDCSVTKRKLSRSGIVKFLAEVEPCAIGMEACGSAHNWARRFCDPAWKIGSDSLLMKLRRRFAWFARNQRHAVSSRLKVAPAWVFRCRYV